ncbi:MAG: hypothetical protein JWN78_219 [Bacteroidota bacterium]|nr:hypothetical protein [Bacteroidota bacterium]
MSEKGLYFIAIIPNEQICNEIRYFKEDLANRFGSIAALKVVAHITLKTPFQLPNASHAKLVQWFEALPIKADPFQVELKDFGNFPNKMKPVIYVDPIKNTSLHLLQKDIIWNFKNTFPDVEIIDFEKKFHPHVTVAYRDLKPDAFKEAWREYETKKYSALFDVRNFHLLQHDGKRWNIISTHSLR